MIERKDLTIPSSVWEKIHSSLEDTMLNIQDGFDPERDYLFRIRAQNEYGLSDPSMPATFYGKPSKVTRSSTLRYCMTTYQARIEKTH